MRQVFLDYQSMVKREEVVIREKREKKESVIVR